MCLGGRYIAPGELVSVGDVAPQRFFWLHLVSSFLGVMLVALCTMFVRCVALLYIGLNVGVTTTSLCRIFFGRILLRTRPRWFFTLRHPDL